MLNFGDLRFVTELEVIAHEVRYRPQRDAPYCCDHDNPKFSDDGDAEEFDVKSVSIVLRMGDKEFAIPMPDYVTDYLADEILAAAYDEFQNRLKER